MHYYKSLVLRVLALVLLVLSFSCQQQANVFRAASPSTHWDRLKTWLGSLTSTFLPNAAVDPQHLSNEQLDDNQNRLMAHDPTPSYKEWVKVIRAIAHNLKLQAEDARRNQAQTQHHHDQRLVEIQDQRWTADESKPRLQEQLQRLQKALAELYLEVERRELLEKVSREELTGKLQHSEALLAKAETELKDRHTKAMACENHLKQAQKGVMALKQQRDYVNELDTGCPAAMDLKRGRLKNPQAYCNRLQRAYFRARDQPAMEEDFIFKTLLLRELHPAVSDHLAALACSRSMSTQQLR